MPHTLPLLEEHARQIAARVSRAREAGLDTIWFDLERGRDQKGRPVETLTPVSYYGLESRLSGAADRAGIKPGRRIHGARHHAGTTFQRERATSC